MKTFLVNLRGGGILLVGLLLTSSCAKVANYAQKRADRAAKGNIAWSQRKALGETEPFTSE